MTLFGREYQADLSDQGLLDRLDAQKEEKQENPGPGLEPGPAPGADRALHVNQDMENPWAPPLDGAPARRATTWEQQEAAWAQAQRQLWSQWPQSRGDMVRLVQKMGEISARYGDAALWQRDPAGTLRYAALELYGPPAGHMEQMEQVVRAAVQAGQQNQERLERERQRRHNLAPSSLRHGAPAPLTPEQEILRDIVRARRTGVL